MALKETIAGFKCDAAYLPSINTKSKSLKTGEDSVDACLAQIEFCLDFNVYSLGSQRKSIVPKPKRLIKAVYSSNDLNPQPKIPTLKVFFL